MFYIKEEVESGKELEVRILFFRFSFVLREFVSEN